MPLYLRAGVVWLGGIVVLLGVFLFMAYVTGWPASPDSCVSTGCYCEAFNLADVQAGARGIRQPVNTWGNLYAIVTSGIIAIVLGIDRYRGAAGNAMRSDSWKADAYVFAALFLGLGSMWLHASISAAVSWMDGLSMYVFTAFLVFYTLDRGFVRHQVSETARKWTFWIGYPATAVLLTVIGAAGVDSFLLILALVLVYAGLEFFYARFIWEPWGVFYWIVGAASMENAVLFWVLSKSGKPLCDPTSWFQPHGLLWHPLAGVMALMMFFYWRRDGISSGAGASAPAQPSGDGWA